MNSSIEITKKVLLGSKKEIIFKFIASILLRGSLMIIPILYSFAVNGLSEKNYKIAYIMIILSLVLAVIYRFAEYYNQVTYFKLYNKVYKQYTNIALSTTFRNSIYSLSRISLGEYTNILNNDIDIITSFWSASVIRIVQLFEFAFIYIYFFIINIYIGFITVGISIATLLILLFYRKKINYLSKNRKEMLDKKTSILQELFLGIREIKGLNIFSAINKRIDASNKDYLDANTDYNVKSNKNKFISLFIIEMFRLILFLYGIYLISKGELQIGVLLIIYNYYSKLIENFLEIGNINVEFGNLRTSMNRLYKLIEYSGKNNNIVNDKKGSHVGNVEFNKVLYGNRERPILKNASFAINSNSITVITGTPNSNESGIFDLLLRLNRQHEGSILIDDIDIKEYSDNEYYDLISSARREPTFFNISIKENLEIINSDFERIVEICKKLDIHDDIINSENGYDTLITDKSDGISANIKNLLSIVRLLLKDPKIMLFDDNITSYDRKTVDKIINIIKELKKDHTIVIVTKDPKIIDLSDKVIVVDNSRVVNEGNIEDVKKENEFIRDIMNG